MGLMPVVIGQERDFGEFKWQSRGGAWGTAKVKDGEAEISVIEGRLR